MEWIRPTFLSVKNPKLEEAKYVVVPIMYNASQSSFFSSLPTPLITLYSTNMMEDFDVETKVNLREAGIYTTPVFKPRLHPKKMVEDVEKVFTKLVERTNAKLITIGGEHSITYPITKALKNKYKNLTVVVFDAHADLRNYYEGSKYSHACVVRRIYEEGIDILLIGVRSICEEEYIFLSTAELKRKVFYLDSSGEGFRNEKLGRLKKESIAYHLTNTLKKKPIYISLDVDVMENFPSTFAEDKGMDVSSMYFLLRKLCSLNVVGMDIVEGKAENFYDGMRLAKLAYKFIAYSEEKEKKKTK